MGKIQDIWHILISEEKYTTQEIRILKRAHKCTSDFSESEQESVFAKFHITAMPPALAIKIELLTAPEKFPYKLTNPINSEIKEIIRILHIHNGNKGERVYKAISCAVSALAMNLLDKEYGNISELEQRLEEIIKLQVFTDKLMELSSDDDFKSGDIFFETLDEISGYLERSKKLIDNGKIIIEKRDLLNNFNSDKYLIGVMNAICEYLSGLPNNKEGFSITRLLTKLHIANSPEQIFLMKTNIGPHILHLLNDEQVLELFAIEKTNLNALEDVMSEKSIAGICPEIWHNNHQIKAEIIQSLELLRQLSCSANIAARIKEHFSGKTGTVILTMSVLKPYVDNFVSIAKDGLNLFKDMLEKIEKSVFNVKFSIEGVKPHVTKAKLRAARRHCEQCIEQAAANLDEFIIKISSVSSQVTTKEIQEGIRHTASLIASFSSDMRSILPVEHRGRYAALPTIHNDMINNVGSSRSPLALQAYCNDAPSTSGSSSRAALALVRCQPRTLLTSPHVEELLSFARSHSNILEYRPAITGYRNLALQAYTSAPQLPVEKHCDRIVEKYQTVADRNVTLERAGKIGGVIMAKSTVSFITGAGLYFGPSAIATATAASGIGLAVGLGAAAIILTIAVGVKCYKINKRSGGNKTKGQILTEAFSEILEFFGCGEKYARNKTSYLKLLAWGMNLKKCFNDLTEGLEKDYEPSRGSNKKFCLKVLESILATEESKAEWLLQDQGPEIEPDKIKIFKAGQQLRCIFIYLLANDTLYYSKGAFIGDDETVSLYDQSDEKPGVFIHPGCKHRFAPVRDKKVINEAKSLFISWAVGVLKDVENIPEFSTTELQSDIEVEGTRNSILL